MKIQDNGAVNEATIHTNPGLGMYWRETCITFSFNNNNEPECRRSETHQQQSVEILSKEFWNKKTELWKKQKAMERLPAR